MSIEVSEAALPFDAAPVSRLHKPSLAEFRKIENDGPFIFTGCMDDWPLRSALQRATHTKDKVDQLTKLIGPKKISYTVVPSENKGHLGYAKDTIESNFKFDSGGKVTFEQFAERLTRAVMGSSSETVYMQSHPLRLFPELSHQVKVMQPLDGAKVYASNIWIGSGNHIVNLHFDYYQNFICMLEGKKRVLMLPPHCLPDIYPVPPDKGIGGAPSSLVRLLDVDFQMFPKMKNAMKELRVAVLEPGEVLYMPPFWWHHVESFGLNIMVNTWKYDLDVKFHALILELLIDSIRALSDLSPSERLIYRSILRNLAFGEGGENTGTSGGPRRITSSQRQLSKVVDCISRTVIAFQQLPDNWRTMFSLLYDYYAFQIYGDPFPTLQWKEQEAFVRRLRKIAFLYKWFFPLRRPSAISLRAGERLL